MTQDHTPAEQEREEVGWLDAELQTLHRDPEFVAGSLALAITEDALGIMRDRGINRLQMAKLMHVSRAYVTRLFNAPPNLTLETIARLALALDMRPEVRFVPLVDHPRLTESRIQPATSTATPDPETIPV